MASGTGVRTNYASQTVGTTNWFVLISQLLQTVTYMSLFDSSGQTLEIGVCNFDAPANSEVRQFLVPPGGAAFPIQISANQRVSIRAVTAPAIAGENDCNVLY